MRCRKIRGLFGRRKRKPSSAGPYQTDGDRRNHVASGQQTIMQATGDPAQSDPTTLGGSPTDRPAATVTASIGDQIVPSAAEDSSESAQLSNKETPPSSPELSTSRLSCWGKAAESLKRNKPDAYEKLKQIESKYKDYGQNDPADLLESIVSGNQQRKMPPVIERTIRSILTFRSVGAAAASFDPHKIDPVVWQGFCMILEVRSCLSNSQGLAAHSKSLINRHA
jgi:hypothetical protein